MVSPERPPRTNSGVGPTPIHRVWCRQRLAQVARRPAAARQKCEHKRRPASPPPEDLRFELPCLPAAEAVGPRSRRVCRSQREQRPTASRGARVSRSFWLPSKTTDGLQPPSLPCCASHERLVPQKSALRFSRHPCAL
eukprot:scaffold361_cov248-Pinguiococcus_pyrenoidosus.AAC.20